MKKTTSIALGALGASTLLALRLPADEVTFAPSEGTSITKTFTSEMSMSLDEMEMSMNGETMPMEMDMEMTRESTIEVTDEYVSVADGSLTQLKRTFDTISQDLSVEAEMSAMGQGHDMGQSGTGSSSLEGSTVAFTWDEDDESYARAFEGDGDEDLLEGLQEDMDLRALLPEGSVSEGDEWDVELIAVADILAPGGNLAIEVEMDGQEMMGGPDPGTMMDMRQVLGDLLDGEFKATYAGTREENGVNVGVINYTIDIESARDMSEMIEENMSSTEMPVEIELERADAEFTLEAEGTLLWNLEAGHLHSFELNGEASIIMDTAMTVAGQGMSMESMTEMSGEVTQTVVTQSAD